MPRRGGEGKLRRISANLTGRKDEQVHFIQPLLVNLGVCEFPLWVIFTALPIPF
ncbi:hypothetical protein Nmel_008767, partial [Mimus melanotis]